MAEIDVFSIETELAKILRESSKLKAPDIGKQDATIEVDADFERLYPDKCPWIGVYATSWESPASQEYLVSGKVTGVNAFRTFINRFLLTLE